MRFHHLIVAMTVAGPAILAAKAAHAEDRPSAYTWNFELGAGAGLRPDYEGSSDYGFVPFVTAKIAYGPYDVELSGNELKANILASERFRFGPLLRLEGSRKDVENDRVDRLSSIDAALEVGAFAEYHWQGWLVELSGAQDVSGNNDGWAATLATGYRFAVTDRLSLIGKVDTTYASGSYMSTYFGIDERDSRASGLDRFDADAGLKDVGLSLTARYALSTSWSVVGVAGYSRLLGDAADSPVVDDEGDPNQFSTFLGIRYAF